MTEASASKFLCGPFTRPGGQEVWLDAGPDRRVGFCSHGEWTRVEIDGEATMVVESSPAIEAIFGARKQNRR